MNKAKAATMDPLIEGYFSYLDKVGRKTPRTIVDVRCTLRRAIARLAEGFKRRHLHGVGRETVIGARSAVGDFCAGGMKEFLGMIDAGHGVERGFCLRVVDFRQAVDLFDVEDAVILHVRDLALDILAGLVVVLGARDAVGIDDERAFLAFADVRVEFKGLTKGHPDGRGEILDRRGHPERENVDSAIGLAVVPQRAGNPAGGVFGVPWFHPRAHALFEVGHDLGGDARVNVLTFCSFCFLHCSFLH